MEGGFVTDGPIGQNQQLTRCSSNSAVCLKGYALIGRDRNTLNNLTYQTFYEGNCASTEIKFLHSVQRLLCFQSVQSAFQMNLLGKSLIILLTRNQYFAIINPRLLIMYLNGLHS